MTDKTTTKLEVESWDINQIRPYENNAKIHTEEQIKAIAKSIKAFGPDQPIVVDGEGYIIKGHGRWLAHQYLGMKKASVIVRKDLTRNEANASRLADNRVAQGDVDTDKLQAELKGLADEDFDIDSMGFSEHELNFLTNELGAMNEDAILDDSIPLDSSVASIEEDAKSSNSDSSEMSIAKLLGFSKIENKHDAKMITQFMNTIEADTGKSGCAAFVEWVTDYLKNIR